MDNLNLETLRDLALSKGDFLVSLYAPMQRAGREVRRNEIRWKNLLKEARVQLLEVGLKEAAADKLLRPASDRIPNTEFWQHQSDGLAMFLSDSDDETVKSPTSFEQNVVVGDRCHLRPLLPMANDNAHCFVLATSPKRVRLLEVTGNTIKDLQPKELPENLHDALNIDEYTSALQFHSTSNGSANSKQATAFHGHGGSDPDVKKEDEILQFFHRLDDALSKYFGAGDLPLIFLGVDYLFPIFRKACSYRNLLNESVKGNPDDLTPDEILLKVRPILNQESRRHETEIVSTYQEKAHTDWASDDPNEIYLAAKMGQVESLILSSEFKSVGSVIDNGRLAIDEQAEDQSATDVGNLILIEVLRNGGNAIEICNQRFSDNPKVAAVFRSPAGKYATESFK